MPRAGSLPAAGSGRGGERHRPPAPRPGTGEPRGGYAGGTLMSRRFRLVLLGGAVALGAGLGWWWWRQEPDPQPPPLALENAEPDVVHALEKARARVRGEPRSAAAWGHLGMVLLAHGYE